MYFTVISPNADDAFDIKYWRLFNTAPPLRENRCVILAVDDEHNDRVAGFLVGQTVVHMEPLWIDERYRGRMLLTGLIQALMDAQKEVAVMYTTTSDENVSKILGAFSSNGWRGTKVEKLKDELWRLSRNG